MLRYIWVFRKCLNNSESLFEIRVPFLRLSARNSYQVFEFLQLEFCKIARSFLTPNVKVLLRYLQLVILSPFNSKFANVTR